MDKQKCVVLDIETSLMEVYTFAIKDQYISPSQVKKDWHIMAFAAKPLDAPASSIIYYDQRNSKPIEDDKKLLKKIWHILDEADIVITQNGKKFDSRKINARFMINNMPPPSPYRHIDTYLIAKNAADFTSNSLDYLTDKLNKKFKKLSHSKFPGQSLWVECSNGNKEAWEVMKEYNIHDVLSTEELYNRVKAWGPKNMPSVYSLPAKCSVCGSDTQKRGVDQNGRMQRVRCKNLLCGKWGTEAIKKAA